MSAKPVRVIFIHHACTQKLLVIVYRLYHVDKEGKKLHVAFGVLARREKIDPGIGKHRPVVMLARAIYFSKRFLMEQYPEFMFSCHFTHNIHKQLIVIHCKVCLFK